MTVDFTLSTLLIKEQIGFFFAATKELGEKNLMVCTKSIDFNVGKTDHREVVTSLLLLFYYTVAKFG